MGRPKRNRLEAELQESEAPRKRLRRRKSRKRLRRKGGKGADIAVLPSVIQDLILVRLPLEKLEAARSVCRRWNEFMGSPEFFAWKAKLEYESGKSPKACLATTMMQKRRGYLCLFDPIEGTCMKFVFPGPISSKFKLAFVGGGVAFIIREKNADGSLRMCAWNPLTDFVHEFEIPSGHVHFLVHSTALTHHVRYYPVPIQDHNIFTDFEFGGEEDGHWSRADYWHNRKLWDVYWNGYLVQVRNSFPQLRHVVTGEKSGIMPPNEIESWTWKKKVVVSRNGLVILAVHQDEKRFVSWTFEGLHRKGRWVRLPEMPFDLFEKVFEDVIRMTSWKCAVVGDSLLVWSIHRRGKAPEEVVRLDLTTLEWVAYEHGVHKSSDCIWAAPKPMYLSVGNVDLRAGVQGLAIS